MTIQELSSRLLGFPVREIPRTPPLNKFGGEFENGWEYFFDDLNNFLQQGISSWKADDNLWVSRVGATVTVTGTVGSTEVDLGVLPVCENGFTIDGVTVDGDGKISCSTTRDISLSFIAR